MNHIMLDLETLGNKSNSVILSIGAVAFDINTGETGPVFYRRCEIESQLKKGAIVNGSTIMWWLDKDEDARKRIYEDEGAAMYMNLSDLKYWYEDIEETYGPCYIWGNGARFDIGLLEDACVMQGGEPFWNFRGERDYRTIIALVPEVKNIPFEGVRHEPIDDCKYQIKCLVEAYKKLGLIKKETI